MPAARRPTTHAPTMEQLRHDIDSGRTGDKVAGFDLAVAPLGTDEDAWIAFFDAVNEDDAAGANQRAPTAGGHPTWMRKKLTQ